MPKERLDIILVERDLAESRNRAQRLIMAGQVRVNGQPVLKASTRIERDSGIEIDQGARFISRGGEKLAAALERFPIEIVGKICADVGASTGGFTDCLLQHGALRVYAIDVGYGILHWKIRQDARVISMEETNARYLDSLPEPVEVITVDVSFISLKKILPKFKNWYRDQDKEETFENSSNHLIALIKPQFEAGRLEVSRGRGVIRNSEVHREVLRDVLWFSTLEGYQVNGLILSPLSGPKGNKEFLAWFKFQEKPLDDYSWEQEKAADIRNMIDKVTQ
ncbi:MAG: TlyA family RNA methyltransferase [Anaerolineales bacterium]|jgi:23S rRNA (cytidine1920-2'-O)/16S rRNA (cytidine1409-2'-O)-methyltransferase